jgi:hypothetical protein
MNADPKLVESLVHRNQKFTDFLNELLAIDGTNNLGIRDKVTELKAYLKSREEKAEIYKQKNKKLMTDLANEKKLYEGMFADADITGKTYAEMSNKNKTLGAQVAEQTDAVSKLIKERTMIATHLENEKTQLQGRVSSLLETLEAQRKLNGELEKENQGLREQQVGL